MKRNVKALLCAAALFCVAAGGCESSNDKHDSSKHKHRTTRSQPLPADTPDPVIGRDRAASTRGMDEIPRQALAIEGTGPAGMQYEPSRNGVIYVYDVDADRVIYVGRVRDRERFRLDPERGNATINDKTVFRSDLNPRHRYRLYYDPAS